MRFMLDVGGPISVFVYREKLETLKNIIGKLRAEKIIDIEGFDWAIFRGFPRSSISPRTEYVVMLHEELVPRKFIRRKSVNEAISDIITGIERLWTRREADKRPLMRDSEIIIGIRAKSFDYYLTGTIHVRGSGWMRRTFGDIEIIPYNEEIKIQDYSDLYRYLIINHGNDIAKYFTHFSRQVFMNEKIRKRIKGVFIQPTDTNLTNDYDQLYAVAHRDPRSHFALVMRYMRKKRKEAIIDKIKRGIRDSETIVFKKLSSYLNYGTLYNKVAHKPVFVKATIRTYSEAGVIATAGSLILSSTTGKTLGESYMDYLREVLVPFTQEFPEEKQFDYWVRTGLNRLAEKLGMTKKSYF